MRCDVLEEACNGSNNSMLIQQAQKRLNWQFAKLRGYLFSETTPERAWCQGSPVSAQPLAEASVTHWPFETSPPDMMYYQYFPKQMTCGLAVRV